MKTEAKIIDYCAIIKKFEQTADKYAQYTALIYNNKSITYQQLNEKANQLAHYLEDKLNKNKDPIALCMSRSIEAIVSLLAILKTSRIYVPIDPDYPLERQLYILNDTDAKLVIVDNLTEASITSHSILWINPFKENAQIASMPKNNLGIYPNLRELIAIYYTSGSTGYPKGVMETHVGFYNRLLWSSKHYTLDTTDITLQLISIGFGISFFEIMHPLLSGAQIVITPQGTQREASKIIAAIQQYSVTFFHLVPTILMRLLKQEDFKSCKTLKKISCGGEVLSTSLYLELQKVLPCELYNAYGSTEVSVAITHHIVGHCLQYDSIPIGRAIDNVEILILDDKLQLVPTGSIGMLYVGGLCLAQGYWRNKSLTDEKFISYSDNNGNKKILYNTGDLVFKLSDDNIIYVGRNDQQIKIKGCRIELQEIQYHLYKQENIEESVVLYRPYINDGFLMALLHKSL